MSPEYREKIEFFKDVIFKLYCEEGKSLNYIATLLGLQRKMMTEVIKSEWHFEQKYVKQTTPKIRKILAAHAGYLIKCFYAQTAQEKGFVNDLLASRGIEYGSWHTIRDSHNELKAAVDYYYSLPSPTQVGKQRKDKALSERQSLATDLPGEVWKEIKGYEGVYEVSNKARIRNTVTQTLVKAQLNKRLNRFEVSLQRNGKRKVHKRYRLVAYAFVSNPHPKTKTEVNHIDGDSTNDLPENLEWVTPKENGHHAATVLKKGFHAGYSKYGRFKKIVIDGKYEFKTITAAAKFVGVSDTQFYRYLDGSCAWDRTFEFVY